jgi:thiamine pyrophosphate-dependent acetolactate synthase large subunit-like protein
MDLHNPNIVALAESFGLQGYRVHQPAELPQLLDKTRNGIHIIDVPFAYPKEIFVP